MKAPSSPLGGLCGWLIWNYSAYSKLWTGTFIQTLLFIITRNETNHDPKVKYSQHGLKGPLAAVGLGLLHADGLIYGLHLAAKHIHINTGTSGWLSFMSPGSSRTFTPWSFR